MFNFPEEIIHVDGTKEKIPLHTSEIPYFFGKTSAGLVFQTFEVAKCIKQGKFLRSKPFSIKRPSYFITDLPQFHNFIY